MLLVASAEARYVATIGYAQSGRVLVTTPFSDVRRLDLIGRDASLQPSFHRAKRIVSVGSIIAARTMVHTRHHEQTYETIGCFLAIPRNNGFVIANCMQGIEAPRLSSHVRE